MDEDKKQEIARLYQEGSKIRPIARRLRCSRKTVRKALVIAGLIEPKTTKEAAARTQSKLDPYRERIQELADQGLQSPRILREIQADGYEGGKTILVELLRKIRGPRERKAFRRFETAPGEEAQADWSPYRLTIGGKTLTAHAFSIVLAYSRKLHIQLYRNERTPTLLYALEQGLRAFEGITRKIYFDNMATVTLGRSEGKPIWNERFLAFAKHYMFEPRVCRPRDPNRKGKVERPFHYFETDFLRARSFGSWEELNQQAARWLDAVANRRVHGTTKRVPDEAWKEEERPLLIRLPDRPFGSYRQEVRKVDVCGLLSWDGVRYSTPQHLAGTQVTVRATPAEIEILDALGQRVAVHRVSEDLARMVIDPAHQPPREKTSPREIEEVLLRRFPGAAQFLDGLRRKTGSFVHLHLKKLRRLTERFDDAELLAAIELATELRRFSAYAVTRILERSAPERPASPQPLGTVAAVLGAVQEDEDWIDFEHYRELDEAEPTAYEDPESDEEQSDAA